MPRLTQEPPSEEGLDSARDSEARSLLAEAELLLRVGTWAWDARRHKFESSLETANILGCPSDIPLSLEAFLQRLERAELTRSNASFAQRLSELGARAERMPLEVPVHHPSGEARYVRIQARALVRSGIQIGYVGLVLDRTERHNMELQMSRQQQGYTLSALAGGLAHEINNPIQAIMNYAHLIQTVAADTSVTGFANEIVLATERVSEVINALLEFARSDTGLPTRFRPESVVHGAQALVGNLMKKSNVQFSVELAEDLPLIFGRKAQLQQVLVNLLTNSHEAIEACQQDAREHSVVLQAQSAVHNGGTFVDFSVHDTGGGIPPAVAARMFEPFFTTKERPIAAGLGLTICQSITQQHQGQLLCDTDGSSYTTMHVLIPTVRAEASGSA